jgi:hypothetical protein
VLATARSRAPEAVTLGLWALWGLLPLAILFGSLSGGLEIGSHGRTFTGADQFDVADQLQYMAWAREAGQHWLSSNRFDLVPDPRLFLHPLWLLSGLAWKAGVSLQVAFLAWRPIALAIVFAGFAAYVRRMVPAGTWTRAGTLALALFMFTPATAIAELADSGDAHLRFGLRVMGLELFPGGYTAIGAVVGLMPLFLLGIERLLDPARRSRSARWYAGWTAAAGLLVTWLHPWQGLVLIAMCGGLVAWRRRLADLRAIWLPVVATALPLAYFFALSHTHSSWSVVSRPAGYAHLGWWLVLAMVPPLALAAPGVPGRNLDVQERLVRLWPAAAALVYFGLDRSWFYHAVVGLSLPLAVLSVRGLLRLRAPPALAALAIAAFTVPGAVAYVAMLRRESADHFIAAGEARALRALASSPVPGGVLAREPLGTAVPAFSGRRTWVGHPIWTPGWVDRAAQADALFAGGLPPARAQALVRGTGARFVLADCRAGPDLGARLGPLVAARRSFGCARLYELVPPTAPGRTAMTSTRSRKSGVHSRSATPHASATATSARLSGRE